MLRSDAAKLREKGLGHFPEPVANLPQRPLSERRITSITRSSIVFIEVYFRNAAKNPDQPSPGHADT